MPSQPMPPFEIEHENVQHDGDQKYPKPGGTKGLSQTHRGNLSTMTNDGDTVGLKRPGWLD